MLSGLEADILKRVIDPDRGDLSTALAELVLTLDFPDADHARMASLAEKANEGALSAAEREELIGYQNVGHFLDLVQSRARLSLDRPGRAAPRRNGS